MVCWGGHIYQRICEKLCWYDFAGGCNILQMIVLLYLSCWPSSRILTGLIWTVQPAPCTRFTIEALTVDATLAANESDKRLEIVPVSRDRSSVDSNATEPPDAAANSITRRRYCPTTASRGIPADSEGACRPVLPLLEPSKSAAVVRSVKWRQSRWREVSTIKSKWRKFIAAPSKWIWWLFPCRTSLTLFTPSFEGTAESDSFRFSKLEEACTKIAQRTPARRLASETTSCETRTPERKGPKVCAAAEAEDSPDPGRLWKFCWKPPKPPKPPGGCGPL